MYVGESRYPLYKYTAPKNSLPKSLSQKLLFRLLDGLQGLQLTVGKGGLSE